MTKFREKTKKSINSTDRFYNFKKIKTLLKDNMEKYKFMELYYPKKQKNGKIILTLC